MFPLGLLSCGERAEVVGNRGSAGVDADFSREHVHRNGCRGCGWHGRKGTGLSRIEDLGIRPGKTVEMLSNEGRGALLVKVDESRIAVGRGVAMKIMVRRTDDESR